MRFGDTGYNVIIGNTFFTDSVGRVIIVFSLFYIGFGLKGKKKLIKTWIKYTFSNKRH